MRLSFVVAVLVGAATPLAAQKPLCPDTGQVRNALRYSCVAEAKFRTLSPADTAAIIRAVSDSAWRFQGGGFIEVVADTAWVPVVKATATHRTSADRSSDETAVGFTNETSRVERREGKWVLVRRED